MAGSQATEDQDPQSRVEGRVEWRTQRQGRGISHNERWISCARHDDSQPGALGWAPRSTGLTNLCIHIHNARFVEISAEIGRAEKGFGMGRYVPILMR